MAETAFFFTEQHPSNLASGLQSLRQTNDLCDVVVVVDRHRFHAHRNVLASISGYFRTMFLGEFAERRQTEITLHDVDAASVKTLIDYAYTGIIKAQCAVDDVERLYASAHLFQFDDVVTKCSIWLGSHVDLSNCLHLGMFADRYSDSLLMSVSERTAAFNIVEVADTDVFLELSVKHLCRIVALDELGVRDEDEVLRVISKWIKHDYESRQKHAKVLLNLVRLPLLDLAKCEALLMELQMREWVTEKITEEEKKEGTASSRTGCQDVLLVVGGEVSTYDFEWYETHCDVSNKSRYYDPSRNVWDSFPSLVEPRSRPGLVTVDGVLYAVGGKMINPEIGYSREEDREDYPLNTVERYDSKQNRWVADVTPMSHPRPGNEVTSCLGRLYGISLPPYESNWVAETYNAEENKWSPLSLPPKPRHYVKDVTVSALSDHVYVFHREYDNFGYIRYDPIGDHWQNYSPAPFSFDLTKREAPIFTVANNDSIKFYWHSSFCASFSSKSEQWSKFLPHSDLPYSLFDCGGGAWDRDKYYLLFDRSVAVFDVNSPSKITWRKPGEKYIPMFLRQYGAKFISRNFVFNLMYPGST